MLVIAVITIVIFVFAFIPNGDSELMGVWQYNKYTKYEFYEDGKGCLRADDVQYKYEYKVKNGKWVIDFTEDIVRDCDYSYSMDRNKWTLIGGEGTDGGTYVLSKVS